MPLCCGFTQLWFLVALAHFCNCTNFQVCQKTSKNPRQAFDVQGQRLQGTEAEGNLNSLRRENSNDLGMTMTNWKSQHDQVS